MPRESVVALGASPARLVAAAAACAAMVWACGNTASPSGQVEGGGTAGSGPIGGGEAIGGGGSADLGSNSGGATASGGANVGGAEPDAAGYAIVGRDLFPPLLQRVLAVDCQPLAGGSAECTSDGDCGVGRACVCSQLPGRNRCVPAECRTSGDCVDAPCLLSLGSAPNGCCVFGNAGLFCGRKDSACFGGDDCPGNGQACIYVASSDRFECQPSMCTCDG
jgi:hypothetical protein